jgi:N-acetylglucosaminyldiphosphoundecaprenol N-acetyl-beta-D-mannosaminyltransferase
MPEIRNAPQRVINTLNPHSYVVAKKDGEFKDALLGSDVLLPDGIGIVLASRILYGKKITRIAGSDIHVHILRVFNKKGGRIFYLGSTENTLQLLTERVKREFPNITVSSYSPPFKQEFSDEDNNVMIEAVNIFSPDVLFVGMTAPKQEKWVHRHKEKLNAKSICSIGAVFDFYAGTVKRSSTFWIKIGLEFVPRFFKEPRRLWRRVIISIPHFMWDVLLYRLRLK